MFIMPKHNRMDQPSGFEYLGLASRHLVAAPMLEPHRHSEIELNYVYEGAMTYLFGTGETPVAAGQLVLFWAALPHKIVQALPNTTFTWLTIPLARFLNWQLPQQISRLMLEGKTIRDARTGSEGSAVAKSKHDQELFHQWEADLRLGSSAHQRIVLLEVEARLSRLALNLGGEQSGLGEGRGSERALQGAGVHKADQMARFITEHYGEPLRVAQIAGTVGLHPNYAMTLFRARHGVSMIDYLTQHRIAHAQRLLVTTGATVLEIAMEVGFNSLSRFYVAFAAICGRSPNAFRASLESKAKQK